ncbi:unnamed protein product [Linum trigynum]|uniref:Uncharacterized protein n=1 Tax=Linum trigynum TaxID=586398 RepID=A0AAV2DFK1_9ROSI
MIFKEGISWKIILSIHRVLRHQVVRPTVAVALQVLGIRPQVIIAVIHPHLALQYTLQGLLIPELQHLHNPLPRWRTSHLLALAPRRQQALLPQLTVRAWVLNMSWDLNLAHRLPCHSQDGLIEQRWDSRLSI